jgi:propionyl-CoA synthetase
MTDYQSAHERARLAPQEFWGAAASLIEWERSPVRVLDDDLPPLYRWFPDATMNTCWNALDRHVEAGRGDRPAIHHVSPVTDSARTITYRELLDEVALFAGVLHGLGVRAGDRVVIYLPMIPEAVVAMLACARIGAVHSVVFGGFAPHELAARIDDALPKVVVTASCGIEPPAPDRVQAARRRGGQVCVARAGPRHRPPAPAVPCRDGADRPRLA